MESLNRRQSFGPLLAVPLVGLVLSRASADTVTVTGRMIDLGSFESNQPVSDYTGIHARACALEGFTQAVLSSGAKVYKIVGDYTASANAKLLPFYLFPAVTVTGEVGEEDGRMTINVAHIEGRR